MATLNLSTKKVSKSTVKEIAEFVYSNRLELSNELKMFYQDVKGLIEIQLAKPTNNRMNMTEILKCTYNIEQYVLASGACSFTTEFI